MKINLDRADLVIAGSEEPSGRHGQCVRSSCGEVDGGRMPWARQVRRRSRVRIERHEPQRHRRCSAWCGGWCGWDASSMRRVHSSYDCAPVNPKQQGRGRKGKHRTRNHDERPHAGERYGDRIGRGVHRRICRGSPGRALATECRLPQGSAGRVSPEERNMHHRGR